MAPDVIANLTHWGRVTHICVSNLTITGSDNGLSPGRRQAIIWTNAGILLIGPLGTNFSEILIDINTFKKMRLKMSSAKWRPFCLGLNELMCSCHKTVNENQGIHTYRCHWQRQYPVSQTLLKPLTTLTPKLSHVMSDANVPTVGRPRDSLQLTRRFVLNISYFTIWRWKDLLRLKEHKHLWIYISTNVILGYWE